MKVSVLFFGMFADIAKQSRTEMTIDQSLSTAQFRHKLEQEFPGLENKPCKIAVNQELVNDAFMLSDQDEVALLPPYAGG